MMLGISMVGVSETYNLGKRLGLDPKILASIVNAASGRCWASDTYNPVPGVIEGVPSSNGYAGGFGTTLMAKVIFRLSPRDSFGQNRILASHKTQPRTLRHQFLLDLLPTRSIASCPQILASLTRTSRPSTPCSPKRSLFKLHANIFITTK